MYKIARIAVLLVLQCALLQRCGKAFDTEEPIARVGAQSLSLSDLRDEIPEHIRPSLSPGELRDYVVRWINDQALYQEALARNVDELPELQREFERLKREIVISKLIEVAFQQKLLASDEEVRAYYDANQESFVLAEDIVRAYHLLSPSLQEANIIRKRLLSGEEFSLVVESASPDSVAREDWDLGYFSADDVIPEIAKVVFKLGVNECSRPVRSDFGYHIVQLVDKQKRGEIEPFDAVKEEIRQKLLTKKRQDRYERFLLQTKSKLQIETNFQLLDSALDSLIYVGDRR